MNPRVIRFCAAGIATLLLPAISHAQPDQSTVKVVSSVPAKGAKEVDPNLKEIRVTFNQKMDLKVGWTCQGGTCPKVTGESRWEDDGKTCVTPISLEPGHFYRMGVNATDTKLWNFRSAKFFQAYCDAIYFTTKGADEKTLAMLVEPKIVSTVPASAQINVPVGTKVKMQFNVPMGTGYYLWCTQVGRRDNVEIGAPVWNDDRTACTLPATFEPGKTYTIHINETMALEFTSASGVPLQPTYWSFGTADDQK